MNEQQPDPAPLNLTPCPGCGKKVHDRAPACPNCGEKIYVEHPGGITGGYCMFIKGGRAYFDYNFLDGVYYTLESDPLPTGKVNIQFNFTETKAFGGKGELFINGEKVDEVDMPEMHRSTYSLAETFDVGIDTGTQVSKLYRGPNQFQGELDKVVITLTD